MVEGLESRLMLSTPQLMIDGPEANYFITQGQPVTVTYTAASDTPAATTNFFLNVIPRVDAVHTAIPVANGTGLPNVVDGTLTLDTGGLAPGRYFLYGQITDEHGHTFTASWLGVLFVAPADNAQFSYVRIDTSLGPIVLELDRYAAPMTVANFLSYINTGFYDDLIVHQSSTSNLILGGGYTSSFVRATPYTIVPNENVTNKNNSLANDPYTIAMYYSGDPDGATSQFFVNTAANPAFDYDPDFGHIWPGYCVFGRVIIGMDVIDAIAALGTAPVKASSGEMLPDVPMYDGKPVTILSTVADRAIARVLLDSGAWVASGAVDPLDWSSDGNDMTFTIRNDGAIPMTVGQIVLDNNSGFLVTRQPGVDVLGPGESTTFVISLATGAMDSRSADVSFATNGIKGGAFAFELVADHPTVGNLTPTAFGQHQAMTNSGFVAGRLEGYDVETPDHLLTFVIITQPQYGTVTLVGSAFVYTIGAGYTGSDSFTFAVIDTGYGTAPAYTSAPATVTLAGGQMVFANAKGVATFTDSAGKVGKVTFKKGTGWLFINDNADGTIGRIFFSGTTDKSSISIATSAKGRVAVYGIECSGPAASIKGPRVDLAGTIKLGPAVNAKTAVTLRFGTMTDAKIHSAMPVKSIKAASWVDNTISPWATDFGFAMAQAGLFGTSLVAPSMKSLTVKGDLAIFAEIAGAVGTIKAGSLADEGSGSGITIGGTLKSLTVKGAMSSAWLTVAGAVGTIKARSMDYSYIAIGGALKSRLSVAGWVTDSTVVAAGHVSSVKIGGAVRSKFGSGVDPSDLYSAQPAQFGDLSPTGTIKSFTVKGIAKTSGDFFVDSSIFAGAVGKVTVTNWDSQWGLYVRDGGGGKITLKSTAKPAIVYDVNGFVNIV
jgi:peptidyl-prolyl cis-trans isomerase B (cyclophilin B)